MTRRTAGGLLLAMLAIGCSGNGRQDLRGAVTWNGKPVPVGNILFEPPKGVSGLQGSADIKNGRYETLRDFGPRGGPHVARVTGYDGVPTDLSPLGTLLFADVEVPVEIPAGGGTLDIEVPDLPRTPKKGKP